MRLSNVNARSEEAVVFQCEWKVVFVELSSDV